MTSIDMGIILKNVSFAYGGSEKVLKDISFSILPGTFLGIAGSNGSGKSTLTYLLNGLIPHFIEGKLEGEVMIDGIATSQKNVAYFSRKVGMVFQNPDFSTFNLTVREEIQFGLRNYHIDEGKEKIDRILQQVGLEGYADRDPQSLSFGQKQKVSLAAVIALDPAYIVLDEPSAMLDYRSSCELYSILRNLNKKGNTIIVVEHDTDFLYQFAEEVKVLNEGSVVLEGKTRDVFRKVRILNKLGIKIPNKRKK
ncbi:energy-coupling factor ABC transporter ATP-binding protein [Patescibacteria group bacterium]|nr:energy-coupling factor ABC transporter ATP-binding protein [Patescibacteria group bacterium]